MKPPRHAWVFAGALAACAGPLHWEKPGASQAALDQDTQQCRVQARLSPEAYREPLATHSGHGATLPPIERTDERDARETQQFQKCMLDKGYSAKR